jgi:hypothetical protein
MLLPFTAASAGEVPTHLMSGPSHARRSHWCTKNSHCMFGGFCHCVRPELNLVNRPGFSESMRKSYDKERFMHLAVPSFPQQRRPNAGAERLRPRRSTGIGAGRKRVVFECFPYDCPEPVLASV